MFLAILACHMEMYRRQLRKPRCVRLVHPGVAVRQQELQHIALRGQFDAEGVPAVVAHSSLLRSLGCLHKSGVVVPAAGPAIADRLEDQGHMLLGQHDIGGARVRDGTARSLLPLGHVGWRADVQLRCGVANGDTSEVHCPMHLADSLERVLWGKWRAEAQNAFSPIIEAHGEAWHVRLLQEAGGLVGRLTWRLPPQRSLAMMLWHSNGDAALIQTAALQLHADIHRRSRGSTLLEALGAGSVAKDALHDVFDDTVHGIAGIPVRWGGALTVLALLVRMRHLLGLGHPEAQDPFEGAREAQGVLRHQEDPILHIDRHAADTHCFLCDHRLDCATAEGDHDADGFFVMALRSQVEG
mmetsp:Transcript_16616/g.35080  ORF Transcript_16616/g.35080 Transcript_16616/m.35080 type:complete len:355 (-) Transcript_16616:416-1480(-)